MKENFSFGKEHRGIASRSGDSRVREIHSRARALN
jgi:hypothetical protein